MKQLVKIDENGFMLFGEYAIIEDNEEIPSNYIETPLPKDESGNWIPLYKPKWDGTEWVEGESEPQPTETDKIRADIDYLLMLAGE